MVQLEDFELQLDVTHYGDFTPKEVKVQLRDSHVEIVGKQGWRPHPGGAVRRSFTQQHALPNDVDTDKLSAYLTNTGVLIIRAPRIVNPFIRRLSMGYNLQSAKELNAKVKLEAGKAQTSVNGVGGGSKTAISLAGLTQISLNKK